MQQQVDENSQSQECETNTKQTLGDENTPVDPSIIAQMQQIAVHYDSQPIRAACFSPNNDSYFVLGTNSKSLKFCKMSQALINSLTGQGSFPDQSEGIQVIYEQPEHHIGSIYCVDWSNTSRLVATGSNDKMIKILVTPNFEEADKGQTAW